MSAKSVLHQTASTDSQGDAEHEPVLHVGTGTQVSVLEPIRILHLPGSYLRKKGLLFFASRIIFMDKKQLPLSVHLWQPAFSPYIIVHIETAHPLFGVDRSQKISWVVRSVFPSSHT